MEASADWFRRVHPREFFNKFYSHDVRPDGRHTLSCRKIAVSTGVVSHSLGSALVRIGHTSVICGVNALITPPPALAPRHGAVEVVVVTSPLCSPDVAFSAKPSDDSVFIAETIKSLLIESGAFRLESLCIEEGAAAWSLFIDVNCLNEDGNLFDAALLACVCALGTTQLPKVSPQGQVEKGQKIVYSTVEGESLKLDLSFLPIPVSFGVVNGYIVADPSSEEEKLSECSVAIVHDSDLRFLSFLKLGGSSFSPVHNVKQLDASDASSQDGAVIEALAKIASSRSSELLQVLTEALKQD
jgi:exosome complex component RRP43